ncbi:MAG: ABC transporter substrate-binding protein [Candidatus Bathyarchaeia archaeon]
MSKVLEPSLVFLLLTLSLYSLEASTQESLSYPINGPRVDEVLFVYHATPEAAVSALRKGDIDVLSDIVRPTDVRVLSGDPDLNITFTPQTHYCYVAFNTRNPPLNDLHVRKAVAHLIPRQEIANRLFEGITVAPILYETSPVFGKWHNPEVQVYPYNPSRAQEILASANYSLVEGKLTAPDGSMLRRISFISPTQEEAPTSYEIAKLVVEEMKRLGFDVYQEGVSFDSMLTRVMTERRFDIYFLCVSNLGRYPRWLYDYYHSSLDVPDGENTVGVRDPELDRLLYSFRFESETEDEAQATVWAAQMIIGDLAARIPVYSRYQIEAYRKGWEGLIQHRGVGYFTSGAFWTYLNLHRSGTEGGGTVKIDLGGRVRTLNPLYGTGAYEQKIISLIYDSILSADPETGDPLPYLAESWQIQPVDLGGSKGQRITFNLVHNATWQDGEELTSRDVKFSIDYYKENKVPIFLPALERVINVSAPDPYTVEFLMNGTSLFNLIDVGGPYIIPEHIWKDVGDWRTFQPDREPHPWKPGMTRMVGSGPFILSEQKPGEYWRLTANPIYFKRLRLVRPEAGMRGEEPAGLSPSMQATVAIVVIVSVSGLLLARRRMKRVRSG